MSIKDKFLSDFDKTLAPFHCMLQLAKYSSRIVVLTSNNLASIIAPLVPMGLFDNDNIRNGIGDVAIVFASVDISSD